MTQVEPGIAANVLSGRVAIVTGAGSGLGHAIAEQLAGAGAHLAILEIERSAGTRAVEALGKRGVRAEFIQADVGDREQVAAAFDAVLESFGRLDILVNNAGISRVGPHTPDVTDDEWDASIAVMQSGVFYCMRAAAKIMVGQTSGSIVNVSSIRGFSPAPGRMTYSTPKAAVIMMTQIAASELGPHGIRVNAVAPGFLKTPMHDADVARGIFREEDYLAIIPVRRFGTIEEVGKLVLYLCTEDASYITGSCITIDGGLTTIPSG